MSMDVLLVKEGSKLAAADSLSAEDLESIRHGETVTATIRRPRNPKHHRLMFALLKVVFEAQTSFATINDLLTAIKVAVGYFDTAKTIDGIPICIPRSISFASMGQDAFSQFYERALDVILTKILPAVNRDELTDRVNDILDGRHHQN